MKKLSFLIALFFVVIMAACNAQKADQGAEETRPVVTQPAEEQPPVVKDEGNAPEVDTDGTAEPIEDEEDHQL